MNQAAGTAAKSRRDSHSSSPFSLSLPCLYLSLQLKCGLTDTLQVTPLFPVLLPLHHLGKKKKQKKTQVGDGARGFRRFKARWKE